MAVAGNGEGAVVSLSGVCVVQADDRPLTIHRRSRDLACDPGDDTVAAMRALNGGSLSHRWDFWSLATVVNRLKCRLLGCEYRFVPFGAGQHPGRHVTWGKVRVLLDFLRESPDAGVVAFLDSDAFIRDEAAFASLVGALRALPGRHGAVSRDPLLPKNTYINTGCMILKNDDFVRGFLETVWRDADRNPRYRHEWPHEQFAASAFVRANREGFLVCRTGVLNTPCGEIVRHCWRKGLLAELAHDELAATAARMCAPTRTAVEPPAPFDLAALLDP